MLVRAFLIFALCLTASPAMALDVAALISDTANPYWRTFEEGLVDSAKELHLSLSTSSLRSATDAEQQLNQCEVALLKKPKALLVASVRARTLTSCLVRANAQGVLVVDVDGNISEDMAKELAIPVAFSVSSDNHALGAEAARYLINHGSVAPSDQILVLEGTSGSDPSEKRVQGFKDTLGSRATIVSSQAADWDRARAATITGQVLLKHPKIKAVFAANDTMALGAAEALRGGGAASVHVIGIDGSSDAIKAIKAGRLTASIAQLPYLMAKEAVEKSAKSISGENPLDYQQFVPILAIDAAILRESREPLLRYVR